MLVPQAEVELLLRLLQRTGALERAGPYVPRQARRQRRQLRRQAADESAGFLEGLTAGEAAGISRRLKAISKAAAGVQGRSRLAEATEESNASLGTAGGGETGGCSLGLLLSYAADSRVRCSSDYGAMWMVWIVVVVARAGERSVQRRTPGSVWCYPRFLHSSLMGGRLFIEGISL
jgi:hypothetical protein